MVEPMFGPYRLDGLIGRGGMGEVHRAFDTTHKRAVALKLLPAHLSDDVAFRTRFQREAEITATLREPHVIPIHRYGEMEGRLFLDMRLVDGGDLATLLDREGHLGPARAVAIVEQVAAALDAAHADGLIHRDVKPSNVLVSSTRRGGPDFVYLVDFGIARFAAGAGMTGTGAVIGTLPYMAPERFLDGQIDHRSDVYSLACLLFELVSGRRPFPGADFALINAHLHDAPPALSSVRAGLPSELDGVIRRGLAKSPAARHSSAGEFAAQAAQATSGDPPAAPTVVPRGKGHRGPRPGTAPFVESGTDGAAQGRAATATRAPRFREPVLIGHDDGVHAVATATVAGHEVVISAGEDRTVRVWDIVTGRPMGNPLLGHTDAVVALATTQIRGRPVAVSGSWDETVRVWDLLTGSPAARQGHP